MGKNSVCNIDNSLWLSRKDIILALCNKDGGTHYDSKMKDADVHYFVLKQRNVTGVIVDGCKFETENIPLFVIVRQITHEVLETIKPLIYK